MDAMRLIPSSTTCPITSRSLGRAGARPPTRRSSADELMKANLSVNGEGVGHYAEQGMLRSVPEL